MVATMNITMIIAASRRSTDASIAPAQARGEGRTAVRRPVRFTNARGSQPRSTFQKAGCSIGTKPRIRAEEALSAAKSPTRM